jgi:hypothetical protein
VERRGKDDQEHLARILFADGALFIGRIKAFVVDEKVRV